MNVSTRSPWQLRRAVILSLGWLLLAISIAGVPCVSARSANIVGTVSVSSLPEQGREVLKLIRAGGPFQHAKKDGTTFGNREQRLPTQPRGYYKEYTVPTLGAKNRGARRIVCGGDVRSPNASTCYYTADHYNSFKRILE